MLDNELNSPVVKGMLKLLSAAINQNEVPSDVDLSLWPEIRKEMENHAVLPLVSDVMLSTDISDADRAELENDVVINVRTYYRLMNAQAAVISLLKAHDIPVAVMKGAAAARYYIKPELRQYGDIDMLVLPEDYRKAFELLCSSGYRNLQDYDSKINRHIGFVTPEGKEVELHRYFSSSLNSEQNAFLDGRLFDNIKNTVNIRLGRYSVPVFPVVENGLILLGHINQHLVSGLGLRQIIDWMFFVRAELTDDFWKDHFQAVALAVGMDYLAVTVTGMCQKYLGLGREITWCEAADDELVDELLLYILKKGNFGVKIGRGARDTIEIAHKFTNPVRFFRYLTNAGSIHMEEAGLKPVKAFAWLYQIGHLLRMTFRREKKGSVIKEMQTGIRETDLLKRLKITRI